MALFAHHKESDLQWGIWKIEEEVEGLLALLPCPHRESYQQHILHFSSENRQLEWLSVRVLLYILLDEEKEIAYHSSGKPYLTDHSFSISISHTRGYVSVILGNVEMEVGIDIEHYSERVCKVAHRYMRDDEKSFPYQGTETWSLLLHWSAKEVMFKCLNASDVDFRQHLRIFPFSVSGQGSFHAEEYRTEHHLKFCLHYLLYPDFVLCLTSVLRKPGKKHD